MRESKLVAEQGEVTTDCLIDIITSIKMARRSGQLRVRRGEGLAAEEGILIFIQGQVAQARVERRSGSDALNWLSTWRQAHFLFTFAASEKKAPDTPPPLSSFSNHGSAIHGKAGGVNTVPLKPRHLPEPASGVAVTTVKLIEAMTRIKQAGLSRIHRHLYLLLDGQRSIANLAPLISKEEPEIYEMLTDLARLGIIRLASE
ncbi:MAG TPA: DUF4388 domain-containing protein [Ktedonobacteraceae bacterium]